MTFRKDLRKLAVAFVMSFMPAMAHGAVNDAEPSGEARKIMQSFAKCLVNRAGFRLRGALDLPVGDRHTVSQLGKLSDAGCLAVASEDASQYPTELRFKPSLLRGSVYEVLYAHDFATQNARADFKGIASPPYPVSTDAKSLESQVYRLSMGVGECVVRAQPALARQLTMSVVESADEAAAIKAIAPFLGPCVTQGETVKFSKSIIRSMIAEPLYRLTTAVTEKR